MNNQYEAARAAGYSDEEILNHFSTKDPSFGLKINMARANGYDPKDILSHLTKKQEQQYPESAYPSDEDVQRNIERAQSQFLSRTGEAFLGAPGDIASFVSGLFGGEQNVLPTSQKLRQLSEKASGGYTAPKTEFEEKTGEVFSDIGSMLIPGSGQYSFARNLGIPIVGALTKEGLRYANADEKKQSYAKVGTMIALDLLSRRTGGAKNYVSSLFKKAEEAIPEGTIIDAGELSKSLEKLESSLTAGGTRPTTKKALEKVREIQSEIKESKIDAKRLEAYRPSINEAVSELGGFQFEVPRHLKGKAIKNLHDVKSEVIKGLEEYGKKLNPEYLKYSQAANESYAAMAKSNVISNFIKDKIKYTPKSEAVRLLFSLGGHAAVFGGLSKLGTGAIGAGIGAAGAYKGIKILHQVMNSPTLRKYYQNVIKEASAGNAAATSKNLKALDVKLKDDLRPEEKI